MDKTKPKIIYAIAYAISNLSFRAGNKIGQWPSTDSTIFFERMSARQISKEIHNIVISEPVILNKHTIFLGNIRRLAIRLSVWRPRENSSENLYFTDMRFSLNGACKKEVIR